MCLTCLVQSDIVHEKRLYWASNVDARKCDLPKLLNPSNEFTWRCLTTSLCCTEPCPRHNHPFKALVMGATSNDETKRQGNCNRTHVSPLLGLHLLKYLTASSAHLHYFLSAPLSPFIYSLKIFFSLKSQLVHYLSAPQQVKMLKFLALTFLAACAIPLALADSPTRTFVVRAYQSPYPIGQQLSGDYLSAKDGSFYVTKVEPAKKAQLNVDPYGKAYLVRNILNPLPFFSLTLPPNRTAKPPSISIP